ncbi:testis-expressed protein 29-like [Bactrocera oleae]|uniref:testis-expressed protein 29-like n=1 Tax=Bactrocera oleae TaxID=104688 RepID=UPI00387E8FCA
MSAPTPPATLLKVCDRAVPNLQQTTSHATSSQLEARRRSATYPSKPRNKTSTRAINMNMDTPMTPTPTVRSATNVPRTGPSITPLGLPRAAAATTPATAPATTPVTAPAPRGGTRPPSLPSEANCIRCPICRRPHRLQHC